MTSTVGKVARLREAFGLFHDLFLFILLTLPVLYILAQLNRKPKSKSIHECHQCSVSFPCHQPRLNGKHKVNTFERKTVTIGHFPVEVLNPPSETGCCLSGNTNKQFCSYACYTKFLQLKQHNRLLSHPAKHSGRAPVRKLKQNNPNATAKS
jgi:hypothetical protein